MKESLNDIARALVALHKGLLAADESTKSAAKRFEALGIPCDEETRRQYRQLLITTPGIEQYLSGVIFYDETIRQQTDDGVLFPKYLESHNIIPGIKVDKGLVPLDNFKDETITEGLDGLADRLKEYYSLGARFAKWRAAFKVDAAAHLPSKGALHANLHTMARYAAMCQTVGIVPIVEPEVLYEGSHTITEAKEATRAAIGLLMAMLQAYRVDLTGTILKTSMVLAGKQTDTPSKPEEVAQATLEVLHAAVPKELAGIVFLSGGQTPEQVRNNLQAVGARGEQPWPITFSFSRAVQDPAMQAWAGKAENVKNAQEIYLGLTRDNAQARHGEYGGNGTVAGDFVSQTQDA
ncbi:fructose-bisphosphate aldolase class I [bacterium]|nr:fructose-bisphosphate aldolase class I [bacterium]